MTDLEKKPRIVIATPGKFHSFDLARQMEERGWLTRVFTGYPMSKLQNERLPLDKISSFPYYLLATLFSHRIGFAGKKLARQLEWNHFRNFDRWISKRIPECDLYVALSGSGRRSGAAAKAKGAIYVCDRGSTHIRYQEKVLREEAERIGWNFPGIHPKVMEQEEAEYALADLITVPSHFVKNTFVEQGVDPDKLRVLSYGVDLSKFEKVGDPPQDSFEILFVGAISNQKGIRYLLQAFEQLDVPNKRLKLVGHLLPEAEETVRDFMSRTNIVLTGALPQLELKDHMSKSHVMVLPSLQEGLALVQAQAMACGCPIVVTPNTGAHDLITDGVEGIIVPERDPGAISDALEQLYRDPSRRQAMSEAALLKVQSIGGWNVYGAKAADIFLTAINRSAGQD